MCKRAGSNAMPADLATTIDASTPTATTGGRGKLAAPAPASPSSSLRRNASWVLFGNLAFAGSSWAMMTVLAKLGTPRMVGQYALALAITQPIVTFAMLHLRSVQATD